MRTIEMQLINLMKEVNLILTWLWPSVITNSTDVGTFEITDGKLYVPPLTILVQNKVKLLQKLKYGFKRTIYWNKYQSDSKIDAQNQYLNHLVGLME